MADYLISLEPSCRARVWDACEQAGDYELSWHVNLSRDLASLVDLCAAGGLGALNAEFFTNLFGPSISMGYASCLLVWAGRRLAGLSLVLHDARRLRDKLSVVRADADRGLLGSLMWLETLRFCLDDGIGTYESSNVDAIGAARSDEQVPRFGWRSIASPR